jgi:multiple sugar transport system permease protein
MSALRNRVVGYTILVFFSLVFLYPFVIQLASTFKTEADAAANPLSPTPVK